MTVIKNVNVETKANFYFDGKVTSRNVLFVDGSKKTLGIMLPGEYEFKTQSREVMEIFTGKLNLKLKIDSDWEKIWPYGIFRRFKASGDGGKAV